MKIWWILFNDNDNQDTLRELNDYQRANHPNSPLRIPKDDSQDIKVCPVIEDVQEIDKILREAPMSRRALGE